MKNEGEVGSSVEKQAKTQDATSGRRRTIRSQVPQRESGLALNLETWTIHENDEALDELGLGSGEFLSVGG